MTNYYPAFINLCGKQCVVVGGGKVAERKAISLICSGAEVKVISPVLTDALEKQKTRGRIQHIARNYKRGDLKGAFLVIAATTDEKINRRVSNEATGMVNIVDMPEMCDFIVPSVVKRGPMTIAISTSGASPAMSKTIREELELIYNKKFGQFLGLLKQLRERATRDIPDNKKRRRFLKEVASMDILAILRKNGFKSAKEEVIKISNQYGVSNKR